MKTIILFGLISSSAFSYSTLDCTSNQNISYSFHNRVGGAHPFPGMITNVEEIKKDGETIYRQVWRYECNRGPCEPQQPDLTNIIPENFKFAFDETTKKVLSSEGDHGTPVFKETYVIQLSLENSFWMLCDYERLLLP